MNAQQRYRRTIERLRPGNVEPDQLCSLIQAFIDLDNSIVRTPVKRVREWQKFLNLIGGFQLRPVPLRVVKN